MPKRIVAVDSQKLDAMESCLYQYKLKFGEISGESSGSQPRVTPDYFERGGLLHHMLEPYYKLKKYKGRWAQNRKTHADIVQTCVHIGRYHARKMAIDVAEVEAVIDTFMQYADHWENDAWTNIIAVEDVGSKILYDSPSLLILYEYKIDLILKLNNQITPIDHKTAKSRRDPNALSNQFRGYCWGLGVNGFLVNEIGFQKTLAPKDKFRRHVMNFSDSIIEEWRDNAIYWIKSSLAVMDAGYYPQNWTSCDKYSGCMFKAPICLADPVVRDQKLIQFFESRSWDVGKDNL